MSDIIITPTSGPQVPITITNGSTGLLIWYTNSYPGANLDGSSGYAGGQVDTTALQAGIATREQTITTNNQYINNTQDAIIKAQINPGSLGLSNSDGSLAAYIQSEQQSIQSYQSQNLNTQNLLDTQRYILSNYDTIVQQHNEGPTPPTPQVVESTAQIAESNAIANAQVAAASPTGTAGGQTASAWLATANADANKVTTSQEAIAVANTTTVSIPVAPLTPPVIPLMGLNAAVAGIKIPVGTPGSAFTNPIASVSSAITSYVGSLTTPITFTGYIVATTLTVIATGGVLAGGQIISGTGVTTNTAISTQLTGPAGAAGTYTVSISQTTGSELSPVLMSAAPAPALSSLLSTISTTLSSIGTSMSNFISSLPMTLPLMNAADNVTKMLQINQGILPAAGAGSNFSTAFAPIMSSDPNSIATLMTGLQTALSANSAGLAVGDPTAIANVQASHDSMWDNVTTSFNASTSSQADSVSTLRSYAFAKFTAAPQTPHVQTIVGQAITTPPDSTAVATDVAGSSTVMAATYAPPNPTSVPSVTTLSNNVENPPNTAPVSDVDAGNMCGIGYIEWSNAYNTHVHQMVDQQTYWANQQDIHAAAVVAFKNANFVNPTYADIKNKAQLGYDYITHAPLSTPEAIALYNAAKELLHTCPDWQPMLDANALCNKFRLERNRLIDQKNAWMTSPGGVTGEISRGNPAICDQSKW